MRGRAPRARARLRASTTSTRPIPSTASTRPWGCAARGCPGHARRGLAGLAGAWPSSSTPRVFDWPLNVGGKPDNSTLAFVPITFELTVLFAGLATAAAFLLAQPASARAPGPRLSRRGTTDDAFALVLRRRDATFDAGEARRAARWRAARAEVRRIKAVGAGEGRGLPPSHGRGERPGAGPRPGALLPWPLRPAGPAPHGIEYMPDMAHSVPYDAFAPNPVTRDGKTLQPPVRRHGAARRSCPSATRPTPEEAERAGRELADPFPATPEAPGAGPAPLRDLLPGLPRRGRPGDGPLVPKYPEPALLRVRARAAHAAGQDLPRDHPRLRAHAVLRGADRARRPLEARRAATSRRLQAAGRRRAPDAAR